MTRSRVSVEGGLELLLDTITNTFGSILFITMLVAILLRMSGRPSADHQPVSKTAQARIEARVAELSADMDRLTAALASLPPADPELARLDDEIARTARETATLLAQDAATAVDTARDQERLAELERQATRTADDLKNVEPCAEKEATRRTQVEKEAAELATLAVELDRPVDPDKIVQTATLPELTEQKKKQFALHVKYGRVYAWHVFDKDGNRLGPNPDQFIILPRPDGKLSVRARPEAGHIADGVTIQGALEEMLKSFPPRNWVICVIVAEDSFAQFQTIKAALVELGYQYEPIVIRDGEGIWDAGGETVRAQ
jgi:hypothetical protein